MFLIRGSRSGRSGNRIGNNVLRPKILECCRRLKKKFCSGARADYSDAVEHVTNNLHEQSSVGCTARGKVLRMTDQRAPLVEVALGAALV